MNRIRAVLAGTAVGIPTLSLLGLIETESDPHYTEYPKEWPPIPSTHTLRKVVVVHRHGDRTPVCARIGNNYEHKNYVSFWKERIPSEETARLLNENSPWINPDRVRPWGQKKDENSRKDRLHGVLTQRGVEQMETFGIALRERYVNQYKFLPETLETADIMTARCTPIYRCHMSLASLLTGLYPTQHRTPEKPAIAISSRDSTTETMWGGHMCEKAMNIITTSCAEYVTEKTLRFKTTQDEIIGAFDINMASDIEGGNIFKSLRHSWLFVGEVLTCFKAYGFKPVEIQDWVQPKVSEIRDDLFFYKHRATDISPLLSGRMLTEITKLLATAETKISGKIAFFSGHDTTLIPLLFSLGIADENFKWPKYSASLVFELYEKRDDTQSSSASSASSSSSPSLSSSSPPRPRCPALTTQEKLAKQKWEENDALAQSYRAQPTTAASLDSCYVRVLYNGNEVCIADKPAMCPWSEFEDYVDANALTSWQWIKQCRD